MEGAGGGEWRKVEGGRWRKAEVEASRRRLRKENPGV
jgi:hypothetical protein